MGKRGRRKDAPLDGIPGVEEWRVARAIQSGDAQGVPARQPSPPLIYRKDARGISDPPGRTGRLLALTHRRIQAGGFVCLIVGVGAILTSLPGEGVPHTIRGLLLVGAGAAVVGAGLLTVALLLGRLVSISILPAPDLRHAALVRTLRRTGITERRPKGHGSLLTEQVLVVHEERIYDQDGTRLGSFRSAPGNPSFLRKVFTSAPYTWELVDAGEKIVLSVREGREAEPVRTGLKQSRPRTFRAIRSDGGEIGIVVLRFGGRLRQQHSILSAGEQIGSLNWTRSKTYSVRDEQDTEVGRISYQSGLLLLRRPECIVIEMYDGMPDTLRQVTPAACKAVDHLSAPSG